MSESRVSQHVSSVLSGFLAAAICLAITQIIGLILNAGILNTIAYGLSLSFIAFGGTYAGTFFATRAKRR